MALMIYSTSRCRLKLGLELHASKDGSDLDLGKSSSAAISEEPLSDPEQPELNIAVAQDVPSTKKRN
jgi:hypothetical protein